MGSLKFLVLLDTITLLYLPDCHKKKQQNIAYYNLKAWILIGILINEVGHHLQKYVIIKISREVAANPQQAEFVISGLSAGIRSTMEEALNLLNEEELLNCRFTKVSLKHV